jgi:hypothetical protein
MLFNPFFYQTKSEVAKVSVNSYFGINGAWRFLMRVLVLSWLVFTCAISQDLIIPGNPYFGVPGEQQYWRVINYSQKDRAQNTQNAWTPFCGWSDNVSFRPFFVFDLSHYKGSVTGVSLQVSTDSYVENGQTIPRYYSQDPTENLNFYEVQMAPNLIWGGQYGYTAVPGAYNSLANGTLLGNGLFSSSLAPFTVSLNTQNWNQIQAVRGVMVVGGNVSTTVNATGKDESFVARYYQTTVSGNLTWINTMEPTLVRDAQNGINPQIKFVQGTETGKRSVPQGLFANISIVDPTNNSEIYSKSGYVDANGMLLCSSFNYEGNSSYLIVSGYHFNGIQVIATDVNVPIPPKLNIFDCCGETMTEKGISKDPIRYGTGEVVMYVDDIISDGFSPWAFRRSYSNITPYIQGSLLGKGWHIDAIPSVTKVTTSSTADAITVRLGASSTIGYSINKSVSPQIYTPIRSNLETVQDVGLDLLFADTTGNRIIFYGFDSSIAEALRGKVRQTIDSSGSATAYNFDATSSRLTEIIRVGGSGIGGVIEKFGLIYDASGRISEVARTVERNGVANIVRRASYQYYASGIDEQGQLKLVEIKGANGTVLTRYHYRYWMSGENQPLSNTPALPGMLRYVISTGAYDRMVEAGIADPVSASNAQIEVYAEKYWEYDTEFRVIRQSVRGNEVDGTGTQVFSYSRGPYSYVDSHTYNVWRVKTIETLADGTINTVYCNDVAQVLVKVTREANAPNREWIDAYNYDSAGRETWHATPSAITPGYTPSAHESSPLLNMGSNSSYIKTSGGLILKRSYWSSTTATGNTLGGVSGRLSSESSVDGKNGSAETIRQIKYFTRTGN